MTMKKYTWGEFVKLVNSEEGGSCAVCNKQDYKGWGKFTKDLESELNHCGEFEAAEKYINKNDYTEYHPNGTNYWSKDAPIALAFYPYHESQIRTCDSCKAVFLTYIEYSGHAPQNRCRWVQPDLLVLED
ncbi:MAG: hypothetical protein WBA20_13395 [Ketobacter sp.]